MNLPLARRMLCRVELQAQGVGVRVRLHHCSGMDENLPPHVLVCPISKQPNGNTSSKCRWSFVA